MMEYSDGTISSRAQAGTSNMLLGTRPAKGLGIANTNDRAGCALHHGKTELLKFKGFGEEECSTISDYCHQKCNKLFGFTVVSERAGRSKECATNMIDTWKDSVPFPKIRHSMEKQWRKRTYESMEVECQSEAESDLEGENNATTSSVVSTTSSSGSSSMISIDSFTTDSQNSYDNYKVQTYSPSSRVPASKRSAVQNQRLYSTKKDYKPARRLKRQADEDEEFQLGMLPPEYPKLMERSPGDEAVRRFGTVEGNKSDSVVYEESVKMKWMKHSGGIFEISDMLFSGRWDVAIMRFEMEDRERRHREEIQQLLEKHYQNLEEDGRRERLEREKLRHEINAGRKLRSSGECKKLPNMTCVQCGKHTYSESLARVVLRYVCETCLKSWMKRSRRHLTPSLATPSLPVTFRGQGQPDDFPTVDVTLKHSALTTSS